MLFSSELWGGPFTLNAAARLMAATALGGILGYEREIEGKSAGVRTHMLVALAAATFMLIGQAHQASFADMSRIIQGVATGIGFIGAGNILKLTENRTVEGLTTAANIWVTSTIGLAFGLGHFALGALASVFVLVVLRGGRMRNSSGDSR